MEDAAIVGTGFAVCVDAVLEPLADLPEGSRLPALVGAMTAVDTLAGGTAGDTGATGRGRAGATIVRGADAPPP